MKLIFVGHIMKQLRKFFTSKNTRKRDSLKMGILKNKIKEHKDKSKENDRTERSKWHHRSMVRYYENMLKKEQTRCRDEV